MPPPSLELDSEVYTQYLEIRRLSLENGQLSNEVEDLQEEIKLSYIMFISDMKLNLEWLSTWNKDLEVNKITKN